MKVAIVGTSRIQTEDLDNIRKKLIDIIKPHLKHVVFISGGASGIDKLALQVAKGLGYNTEEYLPKTNDWNGYKERNFKIAQDCIGLYCISTNTHKQKCYHHEPIQDHEKTAGCYTLNIAKRLCKATVFIKI